MININNFVILSPHHTVNWVSDRATGKQYLLLPGHTGKLVDGDTNTQICKDLNAILPEPKTEEENTFLSLLTNNKNIAFMLGMQEGLQDGRHVHRWNSDNTIVTWYKWKGGEPIKGEEPCVIFWIEKGWLDHFCTDNSWSWGEQIASVVCQRSMYICTYWLGLGRKVCIFVLIG